MRSLLVLPALLGLVLVPVLLGGARGSDAVAGTAVRMSLEELSAEAEVVLEGLILDTVSVRRGTRIETDALIAVDRAHAGPEGRFQWITLPGGVLPSGEGLLLAGVPTLRTGERVVLFLSAANAHGVRMPVGLSQGKWHVLRSNSGQRWLSQSPEARGVLLESAAPERGLAYADFLARLEMGRRNARR